MSTVENDREQDEAVLALGQVQAQLASLRSTAALYPDAHVAPTLYQRYEAKITALRWLAGQADKAPVTKTPGSGIPSQTEVIREVEAAEEILYPGHRRGEPPEGIPSYRWLEWVQRTLHWSLGWLDEPHPANG